MPRRAVVSTVAIKGCLQLLVSIQQLQPDSTSHEFLHDLQALRTQLLAQLPAAFSEADMTLSVVDAPAPRQEAAGGGGGAAPEILLEPVCVQSGLAAGQQLLVELVGAGGDCGDGGVSGSDAAEAVVCCWKEGQQVVIRQALDSTQGVVSGGSFRSGPTLRWLQALVSCRLRGDIPSMPAPRRLAGLSRLPACGACPL